MINQPKPVSQEPYEYAKSLMLDRQRLLQALELRHQQREVPPAEYLSCRRSLLQAIKELGSILLNDPGRRKPTTSASAPCSPHHRTHGSRRFAHHP
jgi:hypothetical protein